MFTVLIVLLSASPSSSDDSVPCEKEWNTYLSASDDETASRGAYLEANVLSEYMCGPYMSASTGTPCAFVAAYLEGLAEAWRVAVSEANAALHAYEECMQER